jgi:hypothetical protein
MLNKTSHLYRTALLLSITLAIVLIALTVERNVINIILIAAGAIVGTFILDLDYVIHAYFVEPETTFSKMIVDYTKHKDIRGLLAFISVHKNDIEDKTLNSALFQIVLGAASLFVLASDVSLLIKTMVISAFLNSIYRFVGEYMHGRAPQWFWSLKINDTKGNMYGYILILLFTLFYCLYLF